MSQSESGETVTLTRAELMSGILVGIGGEHDPVPTQEQLDRAVDMIFRCARRRNEAIASTDWQADYCRVHAELQGAYGEISSLRRQLADYQQAYARTFDRLRDIETGSEDSEFFDLTGDQPGN